MATDAAVPATPTPAPDGPPTFWSVFLPILGFVGTGIGVLGFVIFFGGFVLWTRFNAVGLPADEAVWHVPREDLVVTGASFLVPALLTALTAVAFAFALRDATLGKRRRARRKEAKATLKHRKLALASLEAGAAAIARDYQATERELQQIAVVLGNDKLPEAAALQAISDRTAAKAKAEQLQQLQDVLEREQLPSAQEAVDVAQKDLDDVHEHDRPEQYVVGAGPMLAVCAFIAITKWGSLGLLQILAMSGLTLAIVALTVVVLRATSRFAWFALSVFLGLGIVIAVSTYARTNDEAKVSPVALVAGGVPHTGYFVAETPDAVYLAQPRRATGNPDKLDIDTERIALVRIDKTKVSDLQIGKLVSEPTAYVRALAVAIALCDRQLSPATAATAKTVSAVNATGKTKGRDQATEATAPRVCGAQDIADLRTERDAARAALASSRQA